MRYVRLGRSGPRVSAVGLGMWEIGSRSWGGSPSAAQEIVSEAISHGMNFFDTAEVYGNGASELALGAALRAIGAREEAVVASKVGGFRPTAYFIVKGAEAIRRRLGLTPAVLQLHWPPPAWVPLCTSIRGLEEAARRGLTEHIGVSNFPGEMLESAYHCTRSLELVSDQVEYSLAYRTPELDVMPAATRLGLGVIAYSPLAKGSLAGATRARAPAQRLDRRFRAASGDDVLQGALKSFSERLGVSQATVALAWVVAKGAVAIPGTTRPSRVPELARAGEVELPEDVVRALDEASGRYVRLWGDRYGNLQALRYVPCGLQYLGIRLAGGA